MKLIGPFSQLLPMAGLSLRGAIKDCQMPVLKDAGLAIAHGKIHQIDSYNTLLAEARENKWDMHLIEGDHTALPGFVDSHTHICFHGSRAADYSLRNSGKTYLEIAKSGGGIWNTVSHTREATEDTLAAGIVRRAQRHLYSGVTTMEVKSGYGLSVDEELKILRAIKSADAQLSAHLVPTCLAAHIVPRDFDSGAAGYLKEMSEHLLPRIKKEGLCNRVDAFVEEGAFTPEDIGPYFIEAKRLGFDLTVHADQFTSGGSAVAVKFGALSADHLEASTRTDVERLAKSNVVATALPGATLGLGCAFTPARALLDAGAALSIASDWNPGSAPMGQLLTQAAILGVFEKLSNAEVLAAITFRAAAALNLQDRGRLEVGKLADFAVFPVADYREILYQQGSLQPVSVWKDGNCITNPTTYKS